MEFQLIEKLPEGDGLAGVWRFERRVWGVDVSVEFVGAVTGEKNEEEEETDAGDEGRGEEVDECGFRRGGVVV